MWRASPQSWRCCGPFFSPCPSPPLPLSLIFASLAALPLPSLVFSSSAIACTNRPMDGRTDERTDRRAARHCSMPSYVVKPCQLNYRRTSYAGRLSLCRATRRERAHACGARITGRAICNWHGFYGGHKVARTGAPETRWKRTDRPYRLADTWRVCPSENVSTFRRLTEAWERVEPQEMSVNCPGALSVRIFEYVTVWIGMVRGWKTLLRYVAERTQARVRRDNKIVDDEGL